MKKTIRCKCCKKKVTYSVVKSSHRTYCDNCSRYVAMIRSHESLKYFQQLRELEKKYKEIAIIREPVKEQTDIYGNKI